MDVATGFSNWVTNWTPDLDDLYSGARDYSMGAWETQQRALVGGSGAAAVAIPVAHLAGLAADLAFVINRMGVSSFGVGAIRAREAGIGNFLERDDFNAVLLYWADDGAIREAMKGRAAAELSSKVALKMGTKILGKGFAAGVTGAMLSSAGYLVGQKLGGKMAAKAGAKFAGKYLGKAAAGFVPFLGPVVGGGINVWLISSVMDAANEFYRDKVKICTG